MEKVGWREEEDESAAISTKANPKKSPRRERAAIVTERSKTLGPLQKEIASLEARIMQLEAEESSANEKIAEASQTQNAKAIAELSVSAKKVKTEIDSCFARLEKASARHEKLAAEFDARMAKLS